MTPSSLVNETKEADTSTLCLPVSSPYASSEKHDSVNPMPVIKGPPLRIFGKGFCGTVWAASKKGHAFKREDGGPDRSLKNDFGMQHRVLQAFQKFTNSNASPQIHLQIQIPACYDFIKVTDQNWWSLNQRKFPPGYTPCNMIQSQRIPPFSEATRQLLITKYCPTNIVQQILISEPNKDCLIRPYLGRRRNITIYKHPVPL